MKSNFVFKTAVFKTGGKTYKLGAPSKQRGVALIVGIIFLIVLTLFVLGGLRDVLLQERMSGAYRNQSLALSASESLVRDAQARIFTNILANAGATTSADYRALDKEGASPDPVVRSFRTGAGYVSGGLAPLNSFVPTTDLTSRLAQPGAYVIEGPIPVESDPGLSGGGGLGGNYSLESHTTVGGGSSGSGGGSAGGTNSGDAERLYSYRITARATGGTADFVRAMEATYLIVR